MFVGGLDISGSPPMTNCKYLAGVIGDSDVIDSMMENLGRENIHMSRIKNRMEKIMILEKISFNDKNIMAFCATIDRNHIIKSIRRDFNGKLRRRPTRKLTTYYNKVLFRCLQPKLQDFFDMHGYGMTDIVFQCDSDCIDFASNNDLGWTDPGRAHSLADVVAWSNNAGFLLDGVMEMNLGEDIITQIMKSNGLQRPTSARGTMP
ncbi:MAG: hypothetical protein MPJ06_03690 [Nitrosopumilus sp.]|nr:hypothetical protein [Nitrosopumilus sp.]MDA7943092.1 hypothetical protein [Nitrosopumilus sp.]MDA7959859.1 hypothetical protein [Nitrosopumilus sp.]